MHAKSARYRRREREALEIIERALTDHPALYVAYSCGKDSTAMLDLVREVRPDIEARICLQPESLIVDDFAEVIAWWRARGQRVTELTLHRDTLGGSTLQGGAEQWARLHSTSPCDGAFVGMRMDESTRRRASLGRYGSVHRYTSGPLAGTVRVAPIMRWSLDDVAARIATRGLKLLSSYDAALDIRTTTGIPRTRVREEYLRDLRERRPEAISTLRNLYPDLGEWL